jgi:hypothetical protein
VVHRLGNWGGRPFLAYLAMFSCARVFKQFEKACKNASLDVIIVDELLYQERVNFYTYLSNALFQIGPYFETQILFRNMMAESRGLSKKGRHIMSRLGCLLPETTYQRRVTKMLEAHDEAVRSSFFVYFILTFFFPVFLFCF